MPRESSAAALVDHDAGAWCAIACVLLLLWSGVSAAAERDNNPLNRLPTWFPGAPKPPTPDKPPEKVTEPPAATDNRREPAQRTETVRPVQTRSPQNVAALFAKRRVTGEELLEELKAVRLAAADRKSQAAASRLLGRVPSTQAATPVEASLKDRLTGMLTSAISYPASSIGVRALDDFLGQLLEDRTALASKSIELPSPAGLTAEQQQQIVTMAALVIAAQITNDILEQAKRDFAGIEQEYAELLERREKIALLLADVVSERRKAKQGQDELKQRELEGQLRISMSEEDIAFLDKFPPDISVKDFSNDFAAQNLALQFLRQRDPQAYADYRAKTDGVTKRTKAYVRTITGVAAFGALLASFMDVASEVADSKNPQQIAQALPFGAVFLAEALPLAVLAGETTVQGVVLEPKRAFNARRYKLLVAERETLLKKSSEVFDAWRKRSVDSAFGGALFRDETPGLLWRVSVCDAGEAGRMLDSAVAPTQRSEFAQRYLGETEVRNYSFVNALTVPGEDAKSRKLGEALLLEDHRRSTTDATRALASVQTTAAAEYDNWNDAQLLRLIFANHAGPIAHAQMQVGDTLLRPMPSMQSIFEYESFVDGCNDKLKTPMKSASL